MRASEGIFSRLLRHDFRIAINTARAIFSGWPDRLIAGIMLLAALAVMRSWFVDRSWTIAAWAALGAGIKQSTFYDLDRLECPSSILPSDRTAVFTLSPTQSGPSPIHHA